MNITTERMAGAAVVHFSGAADVNAVSSIRKALGDSLKTADSRVVCDFSELNFVCSDALGAFISAHQEAKSRGGYVRLAHPCRRIAEILSTTQLNRLFSVFDTVDAALQDAPGREKR